VAEQSLQVAPNVPQVASLCFMHFPPWQQPERHETRLQFPPEPPDEPLEPEEPLLDPEDEPLEPEDPAPPVHVPDWQVWPVAVQSTQLTPFKPHADSSRPTLQLPLASQHPPQIAAHPLVASPPSSPASSPTELSSPPVGDPPELVLLGAPLLLLLRPTPLVLPEELPLELPEEELLLPASARGVVVIGVESSPSVSKVDPPPVAQAATVTSASATAL
jgi:hypothetical protein